jgi:hypothetical protein
MAHRPHRTSMPVAAALGGGVISGLGCTAQELTVTAVQAQIARVWGLGDGEYVAGQGLPVWCGLPSPGIPRTSPRPPGRPARPVPLL